MLGEVAGPDAYSAAPVPARRRAHALFDAVAASSVEPRRSSCSRSRSTISTRRIRSTRSRRVRRRQSARVRRLVEPSRTGSDFETFADSCGDAPSQPVHGVRQTDSTPEPDARRRPVRARRRLGNGSDKSLQIGLVSLLLRRALPRRGAPAAIGAGWHGARHRVRGARPSLALVHRHRGARRRGQITRGSAGCSPFVDRYRVRASSATRQRPPLHDLGRRRVRRGRRATSFAADVAPTPTTRSATTRSSSAPASSSIAFGLARRRARVGRGALLAVPRRSSPPPSALTGGRRAAPRSRTRRPSSSRPL